jgi:hypothetical protein
LRLYQKNKQQKFLETLEKRNKKSNCYRKHIKTSVTALTLWKSNLLERFAFFQIAAPPPKLWFERLRASLTGT